MKSILGLLMAMMGALVLGMVACGGEGGGEGFLLGGIASGRTSGTNPGPAAAATKAGVPPEALFLNGSDRIYLDKGVRQDNLTVFPLISSNAGKANPYEPLDRAMDKGDLTVRELSSASVPVLEVKNKGKGKAFIMTGEIVTGAKQDRMSAHDVILPPKEQAVNLKVYCVEQGRWVETSRQFTAGKTAGTTLLRKTAAKKGSQGQVWSKVSRKSGQASVQSNTGTLQAVYNNRNVQERIAAFEKALAPLGSQRKDMVGFVAAVDGAVVSADLFANHDLMQALWPKLLKAVAIDAITSASPRDRMPSEQEVRAFLKRGYKGARKKTDNPGMGAEYLVEAGSDIDGTLLVYNGEMVHLSLFGPDREEHPRALQPARRSPPSSLQQEVDFHPASNLDVMDNPSGIRQEAQPQTYRAPAAIEQRRQIRSLMMIKRKTKQHINATEQRSDVRK